MGAAASAPAASVRLLFTIFASCSAAGAVFIALFLRPHATQRGEGSVVEERSKFSNSFRGDDSTTSNSQGESFGRRITATFRVLGDKRLVLAVICIGLHTGMEQSFIWGAFSSDFVAPTFGEGTVGTVQIMFGACDAAGSLLVGRLEKTTGRLFLFLLALALQASVLLVLLLRPALVCVGGAEERVRYCGQEGERVIWPLLLCAGLWGLGDAIFMTNGNALIGHFFGGSDRCEAAFSANNFAKSLVTAVGFFTLPLISLSVKIYLPLGTAACAALAMLALRGVAKLD